MRREEEVCEKLYFPTILRVFMHQHILTFDRIRTCKLKIAKSTNFCSSLLFSVCSSLPESDVCLYLIKKMYWHFRCHIGTSIL